MFSVISVCLSVCSQAGPHVTITHDALDLTMQGILAPPPRYGAYLYWYLLIVTSHGQNWRPI